MGKSNFCIVCIKQKFFFLKIREANRSHTFFSLLPLPSPPSSPPPKKKRVGVGLCFYFFLKAEEIENAAYIIPRSMIASVCVNGTLGIGMLIAILFCLGDLENALASPTGFPFIEIFTQATYSKAGGTLMVWLIPHPLPPSPPQKK